MNGKPDMIREGPYFVVGDLYGQGVSRSGSITTFAAAKQQRAFLAAKRDGVSYVVVDSRDAVVINAQGEERTLI